MKTLIFIVSETGSGKDTVAAMLPYPKVVSYTTRPMRREDVNGIHHHFVTESFYQNNIKDRSDIVSYTKTGNVRYWALEKDLEDVSIYIINPDGVRWFRENYKGREMKYIVIGLYIYLWKSELRDVKTEVILLVRSIKEWLTNNMIMIYLDLTVSLII